MDPLELEHATAVDHGNMTRNDNDVWPSDVPLGTFSIDPFRNAEYPGATHHILFVCPFAKRCGVLLGPATVPRPAEGKLNIWQFDGNLDQPTIQPSINCIAEKDGKPTGGCGWHGFITNGVIR